MPPIVDITTAGLRRSTCVRKEPLHFTFKSFFTFVCAFGSGSLSFLSWAQDPSVFYSAAENMAFATVNQYHSADRRFDDTLNSLHPMAFVVGKENNETYTFKEMLKQPDSADFIQAMVDEVEQHEQRNHWTVIP